MKAVRDVSIISGLSRRTLQYYDEIGLLKPAATKPSGYRLYDDECLERLWRILFYKELGFTLEEIKKILDNAPEMEKKLMKKHQALLVNKQERLAQMLRSISCILEGTFDASMLKDFDMRSFEEERGENQKITIRKLREGDPFYDFFRPLIEFKLTSRIGLSSMIRNIRNSSNMDWDTIRLKGEEIGASFVSLMQDGCSPDSQPALEAVSDFKEYVGSQLFSCETEVMSELSYLYLKNAESIDKDQEGLARYVSESLESYIRSR
ncbi:MAG: MerR family transcriptional regulator [Clostridiales bacterium]|nr:MerR family transcriptional regulator [Clostridiales bacterium]